MTSNEDLDCSEKQSLAEGLRFLKLNSIGSACRSLVRTHCDEIAERQFRKAYKVRSTLVHKGIVPSQAEVVPLLSALGSIVQRILVQQINKREQP